MLDFMKTIISAVKNYVKNSTADFSQNDETALNYIKNRTHYDSRRTITNGVNLVLENPEGKERVVNCRWQDGEIQCEGGYVKISEETLTLEEIKSLEYLWADKNEYYRYLEDAIYIEENLIFVDYSFLSVFKETEFTESEDEGYETVTLTKGVWVYYSKYGDSYNCWVTNIRGFEYKVGELKQLDKKYLSHLYWKDIAHHVDGKVIYEENALEFENDYRIYDILPNTAMLEEGKIYTVIFDGVEYKCLARKDGYDDVYIGNQSIIKNTGEWEFPEAIKSDEPFFIATYKSDQWNVIAVSELGTHSLSISDESYDRIDEKYLPKLHSDWDTLLNKPFYSEFIEDGYIMHSTSYSVLREDSGIDSSIYVMNIDDIRLSGQVELGSKYTVVYDGEEYTATLFEDEGGYYLGINYYTTNYYNPESLPFGFWFNVNRDTIQLLCASTFGVHSFAIKGREEVIHNLEEKYLPTSILDLPNELEKLSEEALKLKWNIIKTSEIAIESNLLTPSGNLKTILSEYTDAKFYNTEYSFFARVGYPRADEIEALVNSMKAAVQIRTSSGTSSINDVYINNRMVSIDSSNQFIIVYYQNNPIILLNREQLSGAYFRYNLYLRHTGNIRVDSLTYCSNFSSRNNMRLFTAYSGNKVAWEHEVIKTPTTATEGQMLVVKEVDENGKPIEWECVEQKNELPTLMQEDEGKFAQVVDGKWTMVDYVSSNLKTAVEDTINAYIEEALGGEY